MTVEATFCPEPLLPLVLAGPTAHHSGGLAGGEVPEANSTALCPLSAGNGRSS